MISRILTLVLIVVAVLTGLLLYKQWTREPPKVSGIVEADDVRLGSRVGGRVQKVNVQEGDQVSAGQVLIELDPFDLQARRAEADAQLKAAQAELERLSAGYRSEEVDQARAHRDQLAAHLKKLETGPRQQEIVAARARLEQANATLNLAEQNYQRMAKLLGRDATTQEEYDSAVERRKAASSTVTVREQELALLEEGTRQEDIEEARSQLKEATEALKLVESGFRPEDVAKARAEKDAAQAALQAIDRQIDELVITAPVDGVIESLELQPGELVTAGAPVLSMLDTSAMWIRAYVPLNRLEVQVGQKVRVTIDNLPGKEITGEVIFINRQAEFTPSNAQTYDERAKQVFRVKVQLPGNLKKVRPGMTGDVYF